MNQNEPEVKAKESPAQVARGLRWGLEEAGRRTCEILEKIMVACPTDDRHVNDVERQCRIIEGRIRATYQQIRTYRRSRDEKDWKDAEDGTTKREKTLEETLRDAHDALNRRCRELGEKPPSDPPSCDPKTMGARIMNSPTPLGPAQKTLAERIDQDMRRSHEAYVRELLRLHDDRMQAIQDRIRILRDMLP